MDPQAISKKLGPFSLIAALVLTSLNIGYFYLSVRKDRLDIRRTETELEISRANAADLKPQYDVYFVEITPSLFSSMLEGSLKLDMKPTFLKFPVLKNEISDAGLADGPPVSAYTKLKRLGMSEKNYGRRAVVVLAIQQIGKRMARNVRIVCDKVVVPMDKYVDLYGLNDIFGSGITKLLGSNSSSEVTMQLGDINTGNGIVVPLFIRDIFTSRSNMIGFTENVIYIPKTVLYRDDLKGTEEVLPIRKMLDHGLIISSEITIRG